MEHQDYSDKMDRLRYQINQVKDWLVRLDLQQMLVNCRRQYTLMDQEMVNCRRSRKVTIRYIELTQTLEKWIKTLEKRITWASFL